MLPLTRSIRSTFRYVQSHSITLHSMTTPRPRLRAPIHLVLDFDGTLTEKDTMSQLANIAWARDNRLGIVRPDEYYRNHWNSFVEDYLKDYAAHKEKDFPKTSDPEAYRVG